LVSGSTTINAGNWTLRLWALENNAGTTDDSKVTLPQSVTFTTGTTGGAGHMVGSYSGKHLPSSTDEGQAYLAANRHVECTDCHNVHAATASNPLNGAPGIDPTNSTAGAAPTSYVPVTVTDPDLEYKVCFKCNTDWAGYTALAFFDSRNSPPLPVSFHPSHVGITLAI